jgi:hypothetical protein
LAVENGLIDDDRVVSSLEGTEKKAASQTGARLDNGFSLFPELYSQTYPQIVWKMENSPLR